MTLPRFYVVQGEGVKKGWMGQAIILDRAFNHREVWCSTVIGGSGHKSGADKAREKCDELNRKHGCV